MKIAFKNEYYTLFFQEDAEIAQKTRLFITFTSLIQMEWINASHVDKNNIFKNLKKKKLLFHVFVDFFSA